MLGDKRALDAPEREATRARAWPPAGTWWLTRDSSVAGDLDDYVDVWTAPPVRFLIEGVRGAYWLTAEWSLASRFGRYTVESMRAWLGVVPDTDRECLRIG